MYVREWATVSADSRRQVSVRGKERGPLVDDAVSDVNSQWCAVQASVRAVSTAHALANAATLRNCASHQALAQLRCLLHLCEAKLYADLYTWARARGGGKLVKVAGASRSGSLFLGCHARERERRAQLARAGDLRRAIGC